MSIKKIAERAGVSPSTVSRVLNNPDYRCSTEELRDKIWKIAMEMNYTPNEAARNLKMGGTRKTEKQQYICILMTRIHDMNADPFFRELFRIIESEIYKNPCVLTRVFQMPVFSNDRKCAAANLDRIVEDMYDQIPSGKQTGLVIIGKCNREALKKLKRKFKNVVSVNRNSTNYDVDEVTCDGKKAATMAMEHLIRLGHKNIGYVGECQNELRLKGYQETLERHDLEMDLSWVIQTDQTEQQGFSAMERYLQMEDPPTAIFCANDITAIGLLKCLNQSKKRYYTPSVISCDDIDLAQEITPMLTTVHLPKEEMGKFAVFLLLDRMNGGHRDVVRIEMEGKLMVRNSCASVEDSGWCDYII